MTGVQTCALPISNGQLCLADASDAQHGDVQRIVEEYQAKNQRIVYKKIENKGIAANTNAAAQLATGEYLALADHEGLRRCGSTSAMAADTARWSYDLF